MSWNTGGIYLVHFHQVKWLRLIWAEKYAVQKAFLCLVLPGQWPLLSLRYADMWPRARVAPTPGCSVRQWWGAGPCLSQAFSLRCAPDTDTQKCMHLPSSIRQAGFLSPGRQGLLRVRSAHSTAQPAVVTLAFWKGIPCTLRCPFNYAWICDFCHNTVLFGLQTL